MSNLKEKLRAASIISKEVFSITTSLLGIAAFYGKDIAKWLEIIDITNNTLVEILGTLACSALGINAFLRIIEDAFNGILHTKKNSQNDNN